MEWFHCLKCRIIQGYSGQFYIAQIKQGKVPECDYCDDKMVAGKLPKMKQDG